MAESNGNAPRMQIEYWDVEKLIPYARNPRKNDEAVPKMAGVIKEFGFKVPIVAKSDGSVIDGHLRLKAAQMLGMKQVPVVLADEWTPAQVKAFRLAVNKSAEWAEWDDELLQLELDDLKNDDFDLDLIGFDIDTGNEDLDTEDIEDDTYTTKVDVPQYTPTGANVTLEACYNPTKYEALLKEINSSDLTEDIKVFLRIAATRHIEFSYKNIAEFYAGKANAEAQKLFEKMALVIIDYDDALKNGYVKITKELEKIMEQEKKCEIVVLPHLSLHMADLTRSILSKHLKRLDILARFT